MKRIGTTVLAAAFVMGMTAAAFAGPGCGKSKSGCGGAKATTAAAIGGCQGKATESTDVVEAGVARVMEALPHMTYKVGALETPCSVTAKTASEASQTPVLYVVDGQTYDCKKTAESKLAELIQAELPKVVTVAHVVDGEAVQCPQTAAKLAADKNCAVKHMVAGVEFECDKQAQTVADQLAAKLRDAHGCSKAFAAGCGAAAKTASDGGCAKSGCDKAKTAAADGAKKGCGQAGCTKATTVSADGKKKGDCSKDCVKAATAAAVAEAKGGCAKSGCDKAKTASADGGCSKTCAKAVEAQTADAGADESPELANAKLLVREIVAYVATAKNS